MRLGPKKTVRELDGPLGLSVKVGKARLGTGTSGLKAILSALAGHATSEGVIPRVGIRTLASCAGMVTSTAVLAIAELQRRGLLHVHRTPGGSGRCNSYRIDLEALADLVAPPQTFRLPEHSPATTRPATVPRPDHHCSERRYSNVPITGTVHNHPSEPMNRTIQAESGGALSPSWMDGMPPLEAALRRHGVCGKNLLILAASERLTADIVETEARELSANAQGVRSLRALLVYRLAQIANIELKRSPRLDPSIADMLGRVEIIRRQRVSR